jgi:ABC-2 type transport system ATP-binding protein
VTHQDAASDDAPVVEINNLTKTYGDFTALDSLSLTVSRGCILGFIGHNGAGKTTAIRILVGQCRPTSGNATIAGADCVRDARRVKQLVGYMPDRFGSYDNMRVREYLDFFGAAFGIRRKDRTKRIDEVLDITGSRYMQDRYVEALSHGMQQRIGIARTLLHDPEVLILDEPANGLDPEARIEMRELLLRLSELGKTLIVTSHILPELSHICDRVAILHQGQLKAIGTLDEVTRQVQQTRMIEVQVAGQDQLTLAESVLKESLADESGITVSVAESMIRFRSSQTDAELGTTLKQLIDAGVLVIQFREVAGNLEDAFLSVTRAGNDAAFENKAAPTSEATSGDEATPANQVPSATGGAE